MIPLISLAIFSGLSLNLLLSFALGAQDVAGDFSGKNEIRRPIPFFQLGVLFISVIILWVFFSFIIPPYWRGFARYFLFFPLSSLLCMALESFGNLVFSATGGIKKVFSSLSAYNGLVPASLLITFILADNFSSMLTLSFCFAFGNLIAMLTLNEIRRRSTMELVPISIRGSPLILISMGLLSLICTSAAGICFKMLEVFR